MFQNGIYKGPICVNFLCVIRGIKFRVFNFRGTFFSRVFYFFSIAKISENKVRFLLLEIRIHCYHISFKNNLNVVLSQVHGNVILLVMNKLLILKFKIYLLLLFFTKRKLRLPQIYGLIIGLHPGNSTGY